MIRTLPEQWLKTDTLLAVALAVTGAVMGYLSVSTGMLGQEQQAQPIMLSAVLLAAPLVIYRRFPLVALPLVVAIYITCSYTLGMELNVSQVALFLPFYSVGAWEQNRRAAWWVRFVVVIAMAVLLLINAVVGFYDPETGERGVTAYLALMLMLILINTAYFGAAWFFGDRAWSAALSRLELEEAHTEIQAQQVTIAEHAVETERVRIARELHDVVAHHVTVMGVQSAAARLLLGRDPDAAAEQLRGVEASSRNAIAELRTLVHTLRDTGDDTTNTLPTLEDVESLVEQARQSGQAVELIRVGEPVPLSPAVELTLYRVAQEALSNARKHAGPGAQVQVRIRFTRDGVELDISDDGRGAPARPHGTGTGLMGMQERVSAVGGTLSAEPKSRGGWLVRAWTPAALSADTPTRETTG